MAQGSLKKIASLRELGMATAIIVAVLFLFFTNIYSAKTKKVKELAVQKQTIEKEVTELRNQITQLKSQNAKKVTVVNVDSSNVKIQILKNGVKPKFSKMNTFLEQIASPNFQKQLKLNEITTGTPSEGSGFSRNPVLITANGPFGDLLEFLKKLDNIEALISIDSIFLAISDVTPENMDLELHTTLYQAEGIHGPDEDSQEQ